MKSEKPCRTKAWLISLCVSAILLMPGTWSTAADWPMLGRDATRNAVSTEKRPPLAWDIGGFDRQTGRWLNEKAQNIKWTARIGSLTFAAPVIADGQVYVGTNNGGGYLKRYPHNVDLGCVLCFREADGKFLWQYSAEKLASGRIQDWPTMGLGASPLVEGDRMWFVSNRYEVVCLDTQGFRDEENDGPYVGEKVTEEDGADIVWQYDLIKELGVFPHNASMGPNRRCSPAASYKNRIYVVTGNGPDASHIKIPAPEAPSLVCFDKDTGKVLWTDSSPGKNILHSQVADPLVIEIGGRGQVIVPQGDGWIRSFDALTGKLIWKFDINPKKSRWIPGGRGTRNNILATPVFYKGRVYVASGQEFEHGEGSGRLVCIDPTKSGDISAELALDKAGKPLPHRRIQAVISEEGDKAVPNPNSGLVWEYTSFDHNGDRQLEFEEVFHRTVSSVAIKDDLLIAADLSGLVLCCDALTGKRCWAYDMLAAHLSASPLIVDDWVYVTDDDGDVSVFRLSADPQVAMTKESEPVAEINVGPSIYAAPVFANGVLYLATRSTLFAIADPKGQEEAARTSDSRAPSGHWPQWRGPNRDNVSKETGLLQQWPEEGPPLAWQAEGIGTGISCMAVAGGRIFTMGYRGDSEYALALDERSGELLWASRIGPSIFETRLMRWLAQRTPTVDEDRVYVVTYKGELVCLKTTTGEQLWRKSYQDDFGTNWNFWGTADYPLVDGDKLICAPQGKKATFAALNKRTGEVLWTSLIPDAGRRSYSAIVMSEGAGERQYVTFLGNSIVGVAAEDGKMLWRYKTVANGTANSHTPIVIGDHVYCSSGYGTGIALLQLVADQGGVAAKEVYFRRQSLDTFLDPTILVDDFALTIHSGNVLLRFDWKTGDAVWKDRLDVTGRMSPTFADGRLYLFSAAGEAILVEISADGPQERGRLTVRDFEQTVGATNPVVAGGRLYLRDDDRLFCYDVRKDAKREKEEKPPTIKIHIPPEIKDEGDPKPSTARTPKPIFVPTPHDVVEKMLAMASVEKEDTVVDLGSGDGRIVIAAAKKYGAKAIGYEIDEDLVVLSRDQLKQAKVQQLAKIRQEDMYQADLSQVNVVAVYLYPVVLDRLKPQFAKMEAGSRIVSHYFEIPGVQPDRVVEVESQDSGNVHRVLLYTTPLVEQGKADADQQQRSNDR